MESIWFCYCRAWSNAFKYKISIQLNGPVTSWRILETCLTWTFWVWYGWVQIRYILLNLHSTERAVLDMGFNWTDNENSCVMEWFPFGSLLLTVTGRIRKCIWRLPAKEWHDESGHF
jgi:hypothetical protein